MKFTKAAKNTTYTEKGALAFTTTGMPALDFFYAAGASRGMDIIPLFSRALDCSPEDAVRTALWMRDARGGAGERQAFRDVLAHIERRGAEQKDLGLFKRVVAKIPLIGRWDDMLVAETDAGFAFVAEFILGAIREEAGRCLAAKWMPRKGAVAKRLRRAWKMGRRQYRKFLVEHTRVVESLMASGQWDHIQFQEVPSLAMARYGAAFGRHVPLEYDEFLMRVRMGTASIHAGAVYPYDILKTLRFSGNPDLPEEQWKALPDYVHGQRILPMVDVSGSMMCPVGGNANLDCMTVAISLGLYICERQAGVFRDLLLTFDTSPRFVSLSDEPTLRQRVDTVRRMPWGGSTDVCRAFDLILSVAEAAQASREDMPRMLIILSDMEFDGAVGPAGRAATSTHGAYTEKFKRAGYDLPIVVFWNLMSRNRHVPVHFDQNGTILVSGFSPALMKSIIGDDPAKITPAVIMHDVIRVARYDF